MKEYLEKRIADLKDQLRFFLPEPIKKDIQSRITELEKALSILNGLKED